MTSAPDSRGRVIYPSYYLCSAYSLTTILFVILCSAPIESIQQQYLGLLRTALAGTDEEVLTEEKRTELRVFRKRNNINSAAHLAALRKISWTVDEYEVGLCFAFICSYLLRSMASIG